jgi:hypothetical protein
MNTYLRVFHNLRLALFPMAYALGGVLVGSTLNRVMIADLGYSATAVALLFAIPLMVAPVRIWIGCRSDAFPILGRRREPYIVVVLGMVLGVWAVANMTGHAVGSVTGGLVVDTVRALSGSVFAAYASVFGLEALLLLVAFRLSQRLRAEASLAAGEEQSRPGERPPGPASPAPLIQRANTNGRLS